MTTVSTQHVSATNLPTWTDVAKALDLSMGTCTEKVRLGLFWLVAAPGHEGVDSLGHLFDDWTSSDWQSAIRIAEAEGLLSWCSHRLRHTPLSCPATLLDDAMSKVLLHRQRNRLIALAAIHCVRTLHGAGVNALWIKGGPLGKRLYGDELLRDVRDIDLLVPPQQVGAAVRALSASGYIAAIPTHYFDDSRYLVNHRQTTLRALLGWFEVDLHWRLLEPWFAPKYESTRDSYVEQTESTDILGHQVVIGTREQVTQVIDANMLSSHRCEMKSSADFVRHHRAQALAGAGSAIDYEAGPVLARHVFEETRAWMQEIAKASRLSAREVAHDLFTSESTVSMSRWRAWWQHGKRATGWRELALLTRAAWHRATTQTFRKG